MALVKFFIKKIWQENGKEVVVEADSVFNVTCPYILNDLIESGHGELIAKAKRPSVQKEEKMVEPSYEKKVVDIEENKDSLESNRKTLKPKKKGVKND